ncbi:GNAT family N-acetyltransferase [Caulobacter sp. DWR3-1-2]|uniref:GNAT family N-acetyltransferase n=1 Tax=Caulobacter sp. DWR3-1-2 TaxID=2804647 RepID=UPI003CF2EA0B
MSEFKLLIDTNIFIGLEDPKKVDPTLAEIVRKCGENAVGVFVHEAALLDIGRDKDATRRAISLSKVRKFQELKAPKVPDRATLERTFGPIRKANDEVDVALLYALQLNIVDLLITEDQGIHDRVRLTPLASRVLTSVDALVWLRRTFDPTPVAFPLINDCKAHEIDLADDLFDSLRNGYPGFDDWWAKCVKEHRRCWTVTVENDLAGIIVRKDEARAEATVTLPGEKILKICTFKVRPEYRGEKLGELLLKQVLWYAQRNGYDLTYVTTYADQDTLIRLLEYYGFVRTASRPDGELVFEKALSKARLTVEANDQDLFTIVRTNYPRFVTQAPAKVFCVPIQGDYHRKLFPELAFAMPLPLFPDESLLLSASRDRTPGNTIRKVYLCRAATTQMMPGDVLLFYQSRSDGLIASQAITSIGVVERVSQTTELEDLIRLTAKRSVFSEAELRKMANERPTPVRIIDFLLVGHLDPSVPLATLVDEGVFNSRPPQSICALSPKQFAPIRARLELGFEA